MSGHYHGLRNSATVFQHRLVTSTHEFSETVKNYFKKGLYSPDFRSLKASVSSHSRRLFPFYCLVGAGLEPKPPDKILREKPFPQCEQPPSIDRPNALFLERIFQISSFQNQNIFILSELWY